MKHLRIIASIAIVLSLSTFSAPKAQATPILDYPSMIDSWWPQPSGYAISQGGMLNCLMGITSNQPFNVCWVH